MSDTDQQPETAPQYVTVYCNGEQVQVPAAELNIYDPFPQQKGSEE